MILKHQTVSINKQASGLVVMTFHSCDSVLQEILLRTITITSLAVAIPNEDGIIQFIIPPYMPNGVAGYWTDDNYIAKSTDRELKMDAMIFIESLIRNEYAVERLKRFGVSSNNASMLLPGILCKEFVISIEEKDLFTFLRLVTLSENEMVTKLFKFIKKES